MSSSFGGIPRSLERGGCHGVCRDKRGDRDLPFAYWMG